MVEALDGRTFAQMVLQGATHLSNNAQRIDALNVFPVPDGDTGTNMKLSMTSGASEVNNVKYDAIDDVANAFAKGLLMGARGNSGVILSQLFRGFAKELEDKQTVTAHELAEAFHHGVQTAYKAVMKPVEGTILTVAKDAADVALEVAKQQDDIIQLMTEVTNAAKRSLERTPDLLPVLKEVGVVDSGGQGLVTIYEGFLATLNGEKLPDGEITDQKMDDMVHEEHNKIKQDFMNTADIQYGYCTEFMVKLNQANQTEQPFNEDDFRHELSEHGDSLLVVADDELAKVHIHVEYPGTVLTIGQQYGSLINMKIENMREQHTAIVGDQSTSERRIKEKAPFAIVTVAMGDGIEELFKSLGATVVIAGGQTMNPSTQDITEAIKDAHASNVLVLPNNKNIVMAAEQAAELSEEDVEVVPTKTIPQGLSAILAFHPNEDIKTNRDMMMTASEQVKSGQVTYAVRDTKIDGIAIERGHFMGIVDGEINVTNVDKTVTAQELIDNMISDDDELLTIIYGSDVHEDEITGLIRDLEDKYDDLEIDVHKGNQPVYSYIFSVE